ncbi:MAG: DUF4351 domain-containing protein [Cyanobacteria bacterium K_DeepCast_35m_m2_023]|nr:DUF4351 domain-containing protein [Cyanobacteria bacterium K_DeepCast_35m_m2_023]
MAVPADLSRDRRLLQTAGGPPPSQQRRRQGQAAPILHLEFQTLPDRAIAERMLEYWIRLHRRFGLPIRQVVIHLKPTNSPLARLDQLAIGSTRHRFTSLRLWEQDPAPLLADPALLPLGVLARGPRQDPSQLLSQVRQQLQTIADPQQRRRLTSGAQLLAGLSFSQDVIQRLLAMSILENPSVYQYIVRKGLEEGLEQGLEQGRQLEVSLIRRQLQRLIGALDDRQSQHIAEMTTEQLGRLGEALLDFNGPADLVAWLAEFG